MPNPLHSPRAPDPDQAGAIAGRLLNDTYLAFNIADENEAFDRLADALSDELVADVYLDSRRRLSAGTRKGAVVTVKKVQVLEIGPALQRSESGGFTYPCTWAVTSRVRHWQHVHSRQNTYSGELTIQVNEARWRISGLRIRRLSSR